MNAPQHGFNFGPPPGQQFAPQQQAQGFGAPAGFAPPPQAQGYGSPPPGAAFGTPFAGQGIDARTALAGLDDAAIDSRYPHVIPGCEYHMAFEGSKYFVGRKVGPAFALSFKVVQSNCPSQQPGAMVSFILKGFQNENRKAFAMSDTKIFLLALMAPRGLTAAHIPFPDPSNGQQIGWIDLMLLTSTNVRERDGSLREVPAQGWDCAGVVVGARASEITPQNNPNARVLKCDFYPVTPQSGR